MTLHDTTELIKRAGIGSVIGIIGIIFIVILIRVGIMVKNYYFPPKLEPPTRVYGELPHLLFPESSANSNFTYTLQTTTGELPVDLPDRLNVFPVVKSTPDFANFDLAIKKVIALGFTKPNGQDVVDGVRLADPYVEWDEQKDFNRKIIFDINSYDFKMTSDYLSFLQPIYAQYISDEIGALKVAQDFLSRAQLIPQDLDLKKTDTKDKSVHYYTYPQLFSIQAGSSGNILVLTTSLSKAHVIRVDFYQKDVEYIMDTGNESAPTINMKLPILYPHPPYSTMSFWIASGNEAAAVVQSYFYHQNIDLSNIAATYLIKTPTAVFKELNDGMAYIASYNGNDNNIIIKNVFLAYYLGDDPQDYLMPIYVFEGNNGFFAYVSALTEDQFIKN